MDFRITGLPRAELAHLFALDEGELERAGVVPVVADQPHAYPCRITLEDAEPGEVLLLLSYSHLPARRHMRPPGRSSYAAMPIGRALRSTKCPISSVGGCCRFELMTLATP